MAGLANPFSDVANNKWYHNAIVWCKANGVVNGMSATTFAPETPISREQVCTIFYNYFSKTHNATFASESTMAAYTDWNKVSTWAQEAVRWAKSVKFMEGTSATTLDPKSGANRGQLAQFLMNYDTVLGVDTASYQPPTPATPDPKPEDPTPSDPTPTANPGTWDYYRENPQAAVPDGTVTNGVTTSVINISAQAQPVYTREHIVPVRPIRNYVPIDGFVVGGSTYTVEHLYTFTRATEGSTIYNKYGIDVTDVDTVTNDFETEVVRCLNAIRAHDSKKALYIDYHLQQSAESRVKEVALNYGYAREAGIDVNDWASSSPLDYVLCSTPKAANALLEYSKTHGKENLWSNFVNYYKDIDSVFTSATAMRYGRIIACVHEWSSKDSKALAQIALSWGLDSEMYVFDHDPSAYEVAFRLYYDYTTGGHFTTSTGVGSTNMESIGLAYDPASRTVCAVLYQDTTLTDSLFAKNG